MVWRDHHLSIGESRLGPGEIFIMPQMKIMIIAPVTHEGIVGHEKGRSPSGIALEIGREWLLLAEFTNGKLRTNECLLTTPWDGIDPAILLQLGEPEFVGVEASAWGTIKALY